MGATAEQIARLRRMVAESGTGTYSDSDMAMYIERYPLMDERGVDPYDWDTSTEPPTKDAEDDWIPTYDLNLAAAEIWDEKASAIANKFTFSADGGSYDTSKQVEQYERRARTYRSRRAARTIRAIMKPLVVVEPEGLDSDTDNS